MLDAPAALRYTAGTSLPARARRSLSTEPTYERDVAIGRLQLDCGVALDGVVQRVSIYGEPKTDGSNVVLVAHALTGSSRVADWWGGVVGESRLLDPRRFAVVGINAIGSCYGSTGPAAQSPAGKPYGSAFPVVSVGDIVRAQSSALDALGIPRVRAVIGGSLGGMQALQWAFDRPQHVALAVTIGAYDHFSAMGIALNAVAREAIRNDANFAGGDYHAGDPPARGVQLARKIAMLTYKSDALFARRFARRPNRGGGDPYRNAADRFDVEGYLDHQGSIFSGRMDANAYLTLTRAMDLFDLGDRPLDGALPQVVFVGITSDWLFPPALVRAAAERFAAAGARSTFLELASDHGHDAFLAEPDALTELLSPVFASI
jgi:homoserine O-acetyltransferase